MLNRLRESFTPDNDGGRSEAHLDEICRLIDEVHLVQGQADYDFAFSELPYGVHGRHAVSFEVLISSQTPYPTLAGLHEMGHVLDGVFLNSVQFGDDPLDPPLQFASDLAKGIDGFRDEDTDLLRPWWVAVQASTHHKILLQADDRLESKSPVSKEVKILLKVRELWARSYELYICRRHKGESINEQMVVECSHNHWVGELQVFNYWQGSDFDDVEQEIDRLFRRLSWQRS